MPITMQIYTSLITEELSEEDESLIHELEISIISPYVCILSLLDDTLSLSLDFFLCPSKFYLADIVCFGVEWRINIDEVYFPSEPISEESREDFHIVPMKEEIRPVLFKVFIMREFWSCTRPESLHELCRIILDDFDRFFPHPWEHRATFCFRDFESILRHRNGLLYTKCARGQKVFFDFLKDFCYSSLVLWLFILELKGY